MWRPAAAGLVPLIQTSGPASPLAPAKAARLNPDPQLEKQLAELDRAWMDSSDMKRRVAYVSKLFTDDWFEILGWDPTETPRSWRPSRYFPNLPKPTRPRESPRINFNCRRFTVTSRWLRIAGLAPGK